MKKTTKKKIVPLCENVYKNRGCRLHLVSVSCYITTLLHYHISTFPHCRDCLACFSTTNQTSILSPHRATNLHHTTPQNTTKRKYRLFCGFSLIYVRYVRFVSVLQAVFRYLCEYQTTSPFFVRLILRCLFSNFI